MESKRITLKAIREIVRDELRRTHLKINTNHRRTVRELENIARKVRATMVDVQSIRRTVSSDYVFDEKKRLNRFLLTEED